MGNSGDTVTADFPSTDDFPVEPSWEDELDEEDFDVARGGEQRKDLSFKDMVLLTICLTGVQITWTVELAYGNPYLRELNLSPALSALVWLAGPLSGLLIQPIVGVYSDKCGLRIGKRRPFMIAGGALVLFSIWLIGYAAEIAQMLTGSVDLKTNETLTILSAVIGFYFLDFSINAVQASCRSLIVDVAPMHQQETANAWGGRMIGVGNVVGYFLGFLDLPKFFPFFGDKQMKVFCWLASVWFAISLAITCLAVREKRYIPKEREKRRAWYEPLLGITKALRGLPGPIQSICNVQFFGWMGIFPFLFYSTTWVSQKSMSFSPVNPLESGDTAEGTRAGSFAMLIYSIVSVITGFLLPLISVRSWDMEDDNNDEELGYGNRNWTTTCRSAFHRMLGLPPLWAFSFWLFVTLMFSTALVHSVGPATFLISCVGICWGIMQWVPFTLLGECINYYAENPDELANSPLAARPGYANVPEEEDEDGHHNVHPNLDKTLTVSDLLAQKPSSGLSPPPSPPPPSPPTTAAASSSVARVPASATATADATASPQQHQQQRRRSSGVSSHRGPSLDAGMVLGIHNIYIVMPQFFATFMCSVIFTLFAYLEKRAPAVPGTHAVTSFNSDGSTALTELPAGTDGEVMHPDPYDAVGWVLRLGAVSSIFAGYLALRLKEVRRHGPKSPGAPRVVLVPGGH
ncbi:major facilitator superfamily domain-containing protein [Powellomyces hirtus]|nr:major facilitator superfamily domain-containing protein [Powellomyces hirtus]